MQSVKPVVVVSDGLTEWLKSPGDGVLIDIGRDRLLRGQLHGSGCAKVRESLRQVDGSVLMRKSGHFPYDRLLETSYSCTLKTVLNDRRHPVIVRLGRNEVQVRDYAW